MPRHVLLRLVLLALVPLGSAWLPAAAAPLTPCFQQTAYANTVHALPATSQALTWRWSAQSPTFVVPAGCSAITANLWSLPSASGNITMSLTAGLQTNVALTQITHPATSILGYPEVLYGYKPFGAYTTSQSQALVFPVAVNKLPNLWLLANYSNQMTDLAVPMDYAYDLWITQSYRGTRVQSGDIELMIWLDHNRMKPSGSLLAGHSFTTPVWINGTLQNATFDVYLANPDLPNHTSELVTYVLRGTASAGALTGGLPQGTVGFNLQPLLVHMSRSLNAAFGWSTASIAADYLNGIELGDEFLPDNGSAAFSVSLTQLCFITPRTGAAPTQANAAAFTCP